MKSLAIWLSWADFLEYHSSQLAAAISPYYTTTTTYLPLDWSNFDVVFAVPGPNQSSPHTHNMVRVAWERLELAWARRSACMLVACTPTLHLAHSKGITDCLLLPWGINQSHFSPAPPPLAGKIVVGWSGRYKNPRKRYPQVAATFQDVPNVTFFPSLSDMHLGRQTGLYTLPAIAQDYYAYIDVLVCGSTYEGFCFPLLEAAAVGRAIISFDVGIARDLQATGAGVVIVDTFDEMREAVLTCDLKALGHMSAEAVAAHWTWETLAPRWLEVLNAVP
jgi:glycosyltransferase involved in cell wall biosynthesis